ncbi:MAG: hypothetical protein KDK41_10740 [Leptospiraceae bacterium]|nr:hypothetical protein [Leptospiraceae bacterium]
MKRISVTKQTETGLNTEFRDNRTGQKMSRGELADKIEDGKAPGYHIQHKKVGNQTLRIPRSNPDKSTGNNLD